VSPISSPPPVETAKVEALGLLEVVEGKYELPPCAPPTSTSPKGVNRWNAYENLGPAVNVVRVSPLPERADIATVSACEFACDCEPVCQVHGTEINPPFMSKHVQPPGGAFARMLLYPIERS
jgi:hypothetical protein